MFKKYVVTGVIASLITSFALAAKAQAGFFITPKSDEGRVVFEITGEPPVIASAYLLTRQGKRNLKHLASPAPGSRGLSVIGAEAKPQISTWPTTQVQALLKGAERTATVPSGEKILVQEINAAKTLIRHPGHGGHLATNLTGAKAEIRPLVDPTAISLGSSIPIKFYVEGVEKNRVAVTAVHPATGEIQNLETGTPKLANLKLTRSGLWRLSASYAATSATEPTVTVYTGTLTFLAGERNVR